MNKFKYIFGSLTAMCFLGCASTQVQVGLKENWIDERDVMSLREVPIKDWVEKNGRPTLVEINGDTNIYYYNYRPTMYAVAIYGSKNQGTAQEVKPSVANATEIWGSRKDVMQIKIVNDIVVSAIVSEGPDKKTFIRDLNGDLILDPKSGFMPNFSQEQVINKNYNEFIKAYNSINSSSANVQASPASIPVEQPAKVNAAPAEVNAVPANIHAEPASVPTAEHAITHAEPAAHAIHAEPASIPAEHEGSAVPVAAEPAPAAVQE